VLVAINYVLLAAAQPVHTEPADVEGKKVVLTMLAAGCIFLLVIAIGELSHHVAKARRKRDAA
jgi:hypothetical protein